MNSDSLAGLGAALSVAQAEFPPIPRDKTVKVTTKTGGSYSFKYAPLDSVLAHLRPTLAKHGLAVTQLLDEGPSLTTMLLHSSGEYISARMPLPVSPSMSAQEIGSAVTYMRRYALVALLGIATEEDDDGNHAAGNTIKSSAGEPASAGSANGGYAASRGPESPASTFVAPVLRGGDEEMKVHFGKNAGKALGSLTEKSLAWYAYHWEIDDARASAEDYALKEAARRLAGATAPVPAGVGGIEPDDSIPFAASWA